MFTGHPSTWRMFPSMLAGLERTDSRSREDVLNGSIHLFSSAFLSRLLTVLCSVEYSHCWPVATRKKLFIFVFVFFK